MKHGNFCLGGMMKNYKPFRRRGTRSVSKAMMVMRMDDTKTTIKPKKTRQNRIIHQNHRGASAMHHGRVYTNRGQCSVEC